MEKKSRRFLEDLLAAISPSGYEQEAAAVVKAYAASFADEVSVDVHGNVTAVVNKGGSPRIMLAGHIDEIGLQITNIDQDGFLRFTTIGGWDPQIPQGQRVWIQTKGGRVAGVIGKKAIHLLRAEARKKVVDFDNMWIDIGARDEDEARAKVDIGDCAVLAHDFMELGNDLFAARGIDDRAGAFVIMEAARQLASMDIAAEVHAVATVQEEIGLRGATTSGYRVEPAVAIAVDVTHATDYPTMKSEQERMGRIPLGGGPVLTRGPNVNPPLFNLLLETAQAENIPVRVEADPRGTPTDANVLQLARSGAATALISIPNRYMHTPVEMASLKDLQWLYELIAATVSRIGPDTSFIPW